MNHLRTIEKGGSIILEDTNESHYLENSVEQRRYSSRLQNHDYQTGKTTLRNYDSAKSYHLSAGANSRCNDAEVKRTVYHQSNAAEKLVSHDQAIVFNEPKYMVSPSLNGQKLMPHRMSNLDLESLKQVTVTSQKEIMGNETADSFSNTVVTHSRRATICSKILNYMDFTFATLATMLSFAYLTALDFEQAEKARVILIFALAARPFFAFLISLVQYIGFRKELKQILQAVGAEPDADAVDQMVAHLEGDNQLRLMAQLIALT